MKYIAVLNGKKYEVEIERVEEYTPLKREEINVIKSEPVENIKVKEKPEILTSPAVFQEKNSKPSKPISTESENVVSPLPGTVLEVKVKAGDQVKYGQVVILIEAMKMETEVVSQCDGVVESVLVKKGDAVETDTTLIILK